MSQTVIQGAQGLANMLGTASLVPSTGTVSKIFSMISEKNAKLDPQAMIAFRDLIVEAGRIAGDLSTVINQSLVDAFEQLDVRHHLALIDLIRQIDALNSSTNDAKSKMMETSIEKTFELRKKEIEGVTELNKILALSGGAALVVLAAYAGYKYSRPKTFWEQVFSLFG